MYSLEPWGRPRKLKFFYKQEAVGGHRVGNLSQESPIGSCSVIKRQDRPWAFTCLLFSKGLCTSGHFWLFLKNCRCNLKVHKICSSSALTFTFDIRVKTDDQKSKQDISLFEIGFQSISVDQLLVHPCSKC